MTNEDVDEEIKDRRSLKDFGGRNKKKKHE